MTDDEPTRAAMLAAWTKQLRPAIAEIAEQTRRLVAESDQQLGYVDDDFYSLAHRATGLDELQTALFALADMLLAAAEGRGDGR